MSGQSQVDAAKHVAARKAPRCQFMKDDGLACGSPALKNQRFCCFHSRTAHGRKRASGSAKAVSLQLPVLDDERAIQAAVTGICRGLAERRLIPGVRRRFFMGCRLRHRRCGVVVERK